MDQNVTDKPPRQVGSRFELAARRMAEGWARAGRVDVSRDDLRLAQEFFERAGWVVDTAEAGRVRLSRPRGRRIVEMTPEGLVLDAFRRLATRD